jgi:hypothetical protein
VLVENGADVNIRTRDGQTALDLVGGSEEEIKSLLETYGAVRRIE